MNNTLKLSLSMVAMSVALVGCQTTSDPTQGGLFSGLSNLSSGGYERRVQDRNKALQNEEDRSVSLQRENDRLNQQQEATAGKISALELRYEALSIALKEMEGHLTKSKGDNRMLEDRLAQLEQQTNMAKSDTFADEATRTRRLEELARQRADLERDIEDVLAGR